MKGWVYVATMTDADGVVKIGYSAKDPSIRIKEWSEKAYFMEGFLGERRR